MTDALRIAWESTRSRAAWSFEEFKDFAKGWVVHPVFVDGQPAGVVLVNGPEIHACIGPEFKGRWMSKKTMRVLRSVVEKHGYAMTQATTQEGVEFVLRLGFVFDGCKYVLR